MRILVCGGRTYGYVRDAYDNLVRDNELTNWAMDQVKKHNPTYIIHGGAKGGDEIGEFCRHAFCNGRGRVFKADWDKLGKAAGPIRNQQMLDEGNPDIVIAFPGGRGTADMVSRAKKAGIEVIEV